MDDHSASLSGWQQHHDQLSPGLFAGDVDELCVDGAQIFRERTNSALRQRCRVWQGGVWIGMTAVHDGSRLDGRQGGADDVMVSGSRDVFELVSPPSHDMLGLVVSFEALQRHAERQQVRLHAPPIEGASWWHVDPVRRHAARARLRAILALAASAPVSASQHAAASSRAALGLAVLDVGVDLFECPVQAPDDRRNAISRRRLLSAVDEWMDSHPTLAPTVPDLCSHLHMSRRALQNAFNAAVSMGPKTYFRRLRLNQVRRALRDASADMKMTVQDVAAAWGFWNMSQFASDYRDQFGESPSRTLARS